MADAEHVYAPFPALDPPDLVAEVHIGDSPLQVRHAKNCRWVPAGGRTFLPSVFTAVITDPRYRLCVLELAVEDGVVVTNQVTFVRGPDAPPLQAQEMRLPIDSFRIKAAAMAATEVVPQEDGTFLLVRNAGTKDEFLITHDAERRERGRGKRPSVDLQEVADTYRAGLASGKPTKAVMQKFHPVSRATASRWIAQARDEGLLGDATPRRAGELKPRKGK